MSTNFAPVEIIARVHGHNITFRVTPSWNGATVTLAATGTRVGSVTKGDDGHVCQDTLSSARPEYMVAVATILATVAVRLDKATATGALDLPSVALAPSCYREA